MVITFRAREVRAQIAHAMHAASEASASSPAALRLVKAGAMVHLVSNASVAPDEVAVATASEPDKGDSAADFVETIAVESFVKTLESERDEVRIVVRASYLNVLGGQPAREPNLAYRARALGGRRL
jgi:hypothetical protein